ncbi:MAG: hypothetical protein LBT25_00355, partial [Candidatus Symbiothrix sp.]|nr:hypothetical protein [Candidatus Symbiothrix sp.]
MWVKHYQVRWTIEVFFKEGKGLLNLGGCQSSNFDAQIAEHVLPTGQVPALFLPFRNCESPCFCHNAC